MPQAADSARNNNFLERLVRVEHGEWPRLIIAFSYFFFLLGGYFMLRPLRGAVAANNSEILHWLYTGTFLSMLAIVPVFGFLVSRFRRGQFIPAKGFLHMVERVQPVRRFSVLEFHGGHFPARPGAEAVWIHHGRRERGRDHCAFRHQGHRQQSRRHGRHADSLHAVDAGDVPCDLPGALYA
jgi:hypothetical protein